MPQTIEHYQSQTYPSLFRGQAIRVWVVGMAVVLVWVALIVLPAVAGNLGMAAFGESLFAFFGYLCHQIPERSLHFDGGQFGVCSRCFGVYAGLLIGLAAYPVWRRVENVEPLPRIWLFAAMVPIGIDWSLTIFGIWENTHLSRFITGAILGAACATYILPALVEIVRYSSKKKPIVPESH
ncbi:MAG: DUF2085 domain-containing protein [Pyrinomonadaceae bacterium]|nr:DUF2085 domain-containing protein [Pyrinomonadaceae bacterium]